MRTGMQSAVLPRQITQGAEGLLERHDAWHGGRMHRKNLLAEKRSKAGEAELSGFFLYPVARAGRLIYAASIHRELAHHLVLDEFLYQLPFRSADLLELHPHAPPLDGT